MKAAQGFIRQQYVLIGLCFSAALLFFYTAYRAYAIPFTIDECNTLRKYVHASIADIWSCKPLSANNHIFNSLLMKLSGALFGNSPVAYRLPNLLAHLVYLVSGIKILLYFKRPLLIFTGFLLLNLNPFLLDFFSLARGYGLSMACFLASTYCFLLFFEKRKTVYAVCSFIWMSTGVLANFSLINFFSSLWILYLLVLFSEADNDRFFSINNFWKILKSAFIPFVVSLVLCKAIYVTLWKLQNAGELYYGGDTGFWSDTITSLTMRFFYFNTFADNLRRPFMLLVAGLTISAAWFCVTDFFRSRAKAIHPFLLFTTLLLSALFISVAQYHLLGVRFPFGRTALCFVPAFALMVIFFCNVLYTKQYKKIANALLVLLSAGILLNFAAACNLRYCYEWRFDAAAVQVINDIEKDMLNSRGHLEKIKLGVTWPLGPAIRYYWQKNNILWIDTVVTDLNHMKFDYHYVCPAYGQRALEDSVLIQKYTVSNTYLYK